MELSEEMQTCRKCSIASCRRRTLIKHRLLIRKQSRRALESRVNRNRKAVSASDIGSVDLYETLCGQLPEVSI